MELLKMTNFIANPYSSPSKIWILLLRNYLSGTDRKNQGKLPTLVGALTLEAHPIASGVGG